MTDPTPAAATERPDHQRWNYNIHYMDGLLPTIPEHARTALDVGCGEGHLARALAARGLTVTGIDSDPEAIARARGQATTVELLESGGEDGEDGEDGDGGTGPEVAPAMSAPIGYRVGDVLTEDLPEGGFDVVTASATLHHMDLEAGLARLKGLVAPGGRLLVVGMAKSNWPQDLPRDVWATFVDKFHRLFRGYWDHGCECAWPAPHTFADVQRVAKELLPGSEYTRELLWRYTLTWDRPAD
ncbi:class I SAM-dependent methyltransferase [Demequina pelophila]|uniref:class I SAM-dependent methyltransferase n=1 Tax=Demequina pelophila TaxID=1638984 RepID=UPI000782D93F|nr:class I SAM-dependent methyltransferase [Demequina pelophila]